MKTVLMMGGNRFVGKRLADLLKSNNFYITMLNRSGTGRADEYIISDRNNTDILEKKFVNRKWDLVYDFSCIHPSDSKNMVNLLNGKVKKYIVISSASVYEPGVNISEEKFNPLSYNYFEPENDKLTYAESKRQMEVGAFKYGDFPIVAVRFPIILGTDDYTKRLHFHIERIKVGKEIYFPNLQAKESFVESQEAADFLYKLKDSSLVGPVNYCSKDPISLAALVRAIENVANKKIILASQETEENHSPFGVLEDWYMDTEKVQKYGFEPSKLEKWLPDLIKQICVN